MIENARSQKHTASAAVFSANDIAAILAPNARAAILPTPEQAAVIEQPLGASVLVIAGAGSGKTETMANRVVWLVANGLVTPSQILGLTFTRKAAGELGARVTDRLQQFAQQIHAPEVCANLTPAQQMTALKVRETLSDGLDLPEISTYNSFAAGIVQEFGAIAGVASTSAVIDSATAWGIAREIVCTSEDTEMAQTDVSIPVMVRRLIHLDHAVSDHLTNFAEVERCVHALEQLEGLPYNEKKAHGSYAGLASILENMRATSLAVRLAKQFAAEKRRRGLIEFPDQLALAVETLSRSDTAIAQLRRRTPVVLLDEVQDTSVGQTTLLSMLYAGNSVMAVGDPHQSIYGFRGASASNLRTFHQDFSAGADATRRTLTLSTSWRNPGTVLGAANIVSTPLAAALTRQAADLVVKPLTSRAQYLGREESETPPALEARITETIAEEFSVLSNWMRDARNEHLARTGERATAAVVCRARKHMPALSEALWREGVPNQIVGLGGLLRTPEITDVVSTLRCVWYADASNELLRLLAGPRFRIGVKDLSGLAEAARWFSDRDHKKQRLAAEERGSRPILPDPDRQKTLLDALDEIADMPDLEHQALRGISETGRSRLSDAAQLLRGLRRQVGGDINTLIRSVISELRLDLELDAGEHTEYDGAAVARANLDAFMNLVDGFLASDERGTLASVLSWLEKASEDDEQAEHLPEPEPGTVQLITVHGAKGLEWDIVAIPRLVEGEFPAASKEGAGWLRAGELPDELRGDAAARPKLDYATASTQKEFLDEVERYKAELRERHADEERRLAYVAITRSASRLLLTASFWGGQQKPRALAPYLHELARAELLPLLPEHSEHENDPDERQARTLAWPLDPLGARSEAVLAAARSMRDASLADTAPEQAHPLVKLLLAERDNEQHSTARIEQRAERLTASTFHEFIENPERAERLRLRPLPTRPYRRTREGNLFHEWVEQRSGTPIGTLVALPGLDEEASDDLLSEDETSGSLQRLQQNFERSRWAELKPEQVELEISMPFAGRTLVCKLDAIYRHEPSEASTRFTTRHAEQASAAGQRAARERSGVVRYEIVDWKTGRSPQNDEERATRLLQLQLYRHAYALWSGIPLEDIDVTLFYVAEEYELHSASPLSLNELEQLWLNAEGKLKA